MMKRRDVLKWLLATPVAVAISKLPALARTTAANTKTLLSNSIRDMQRRLAAATKKVQDACPHLQGSNPLSVFRSRLTCIVWHYYNDGVWRGICSNCGRQFGPSDKDFNFWFNAKCGNKPSTAIKPPPGNWPNAEYFAPIVVSRSAAEVAAWNEWNELNALSDSEINDLMAKVREDFKLRRGCF